MAKRSKKKRYRKVITTKTKQQINFPTEDTLDVVMPIHGEISFLEKSIPALVSAVKACGIPTKYYFVETNSPKKMEVRTLIQDYWKENGLDENILYLSVQNEKLGYVGGVNYGARRGKGKFILITTPDVVLDELAIERMVHTAKSSDDIGVVGMKLLFPENCPNGLPGKIQHAGLESNIRGEIHHLFLNWSEDHPKANYKRELLATTGATFLTYRYLWKQLNGFDPVFGMGTYEDVDFCCMVNSVGKKVIYEPDAVGTHYVGASAAVTGGTYDMPLQRNREIFIRKWDKKYPWTDWKVW